MTVFGGFTIGGRPIEFECRQGTHDYATCVHLLGRDEYGLRGLILPAYGFMLDIGAYIGTIGVSMAVDGWDVICVEPLVENQQMIALNADLNGTQVVIDERAASHVGWVDIPFGFKGDHFYVGGLEKTGPQVARVQGVTISDLMAEHELDHVDLMKIDCEGCEWDVLSDPAAKNIDTIVGEIHGRSQAKLRELLDGHKVQFISKYVFQATR